VAYLTTVQTSNSVTQQLQQQTDPWFMLHCILHGSGIYVHIREGQKNSVRLIQTAN